MFCRNYPALFPRNLSQKVWVRRATILTQLYFHVICSKNVSTMYCRNYLALIPRNLPPKKVGTMYCRNYPALFLRNLSQKVWVRCTTVITQLYFHVICSKNVRTSTMYCRHCPALIPRKLPPKMWARCTAVITQLYFHVICPKKVGMVYCSNYRALLLRNLSKPCGYDVLQ